MYEVPVATGEPPALTVYQFTVPAEAVAPKVTVPVPQLEPGVVPVMPGTGLEFTVTDDEAVAVQLLSSVTVTKYVPLVLKVLAAVFVLLPPLQAYFKVP